MYNIHPFGIKGNTAFTPKIKKTKEYPSSLIRCIINGMKRIISVEMAPMEGITTAIFRRCYRKWFHGVDREYTPFLVANKNHKFKTREKREFIPFSDSVVPQILTDRAEHFLWAARELQKHGYREINLNTGCPSATVTTKGKGAGMLGDLDHLKAFLDEVFYIKETEGLPEISVKTRVGSSSFAEAEDIAALYALYPFSKVIVHPRTRKDFYNGTPSTAAFRCFYERFSHEKLVFNGDLNSVEDIDKVLKMFPELSAVMLGRGLLADPFLPEKIHNADMEIKRDSKEKKEALAGFLNELYKEYAHSYSENAAILKMKEIWNFMAPSFSEQDKLLKAIRRSRTGPEYVTAAKKLIDTL